MSPTFQALRNRNYRFFLAGALVSNVGTWMQRIAQDWLVLELSGGSGVALGITTALQFLPLLLFGPWGGVLADRYPNRRVLVVAQACLALLALTLGVLDGLDVITLGAVYVSAFLLGVVTAVDGPTRQSFLIEMVGRDDLPNAVGLNSTVFHGARIVGPAIAGVLITAFGTAPVFLINAATFLAVIASLFAMDPRLLNPAPRVPAGRGQIRAGLTYLGTRRDLVLILVIVGVVATFGLNFSITMALMATQVFDRGAQGFGLLATMLGVGSLLGALVATRRRNPRLRLVAAASVVFGALEVLAAVMPTYTTFAVALVPCGLAALTVMTAANATVQLGVAPEFRGRVMAIYLTVFLGGTPIGAPIIGWLAEAYGPRTGLVLGGVSSMAVGLFALAVLARWRARRTARRRGGCGLRWGRPRSPTAEAVPLKGIPVWVRVPPGALQQRPSGGEGSLAPWQPAMTSRAATRS